MAGKQRYVAYADLGDGVGAKVDPDKFGGEDSDDFQYMLQHRTVLPLGDPDAAIAMGKAPEEAATEAKDEELAALRARVAELEAAQAASSAKSGVAKVEVAKTPTTSASGSSPSGSLGGGGK